MTARLYSGSAAASHSRRGRETERAERARPSPQSAAFSSHWWRPWEARDIAQQHEDALRAGDSQSQSALPAKAAKLCSGFQHPVKIMWPKSKTFDYLYRSGQSLLANFPVQATLSFYDSKSDDDDDDEDDDDENEDDAYARRGDPRDDSDDADDGAGSGGVRSRSANCEFGASSNQGSTNIQQPGRQQQQQ
ncbi:protein ripply2-like isoform X2 [Lethenteron reissneri]|uniref:protein ripply2-like isoform X2 n=1 Tax=Lethenteron reissneri TaxID=7753 RepID=UPI002AB716A4|nr:protein ripply2-like isoform X2 [Lethenteron reissneri]